MTQNKRKPSETTASDHKEKAAQVNRKRKERVQKKTSDLRKKIKLEKEILSRCIGPIDNIHYKTAPIVPKKSSKRKGIKIEVSGVEYTNLAEFIYTLKGCTDRVNDYPYALSIWNKVNRSLKKSDEGVYFLSHQKETFNIHLIA